MNDHSFILAGAMPRNRTIPDDVVLSAALDIVHADGPAALSFGTLAARVGLAGSTLVQRFGSRPRLLQRALLQAWDRLDAETARADAAAGLGPAGVVDLLVDLSGEYTEDDFADQLLVLREDLRDPVLRGRGEAWIDSLAGMIDRRFAKRAGVPPGLGRLVVAHWQGTLTVWSFTRPGPLSDTVRIALTDLLDLVVPRRGRPKPTGPSAGVGGLSRTASGRRSH
jgi:AcrR family transcriptional regulator